MRFAKQGKAKGLGDCGVKYTRFEYEARRVASVLLTLSLAAAFKAWRRWE